MRLLWAENAGGAFDDFGGRQLPERIGIIGVVAAIVREQLHVEMPTEARIVERRQQLPQGNFALAREGAVGPGARGLAPVSDVDAREWLTRREREKRT